jgi:hypothetical protein
MAGDPTLHFEIASQTVIQRHMVDLSHTLRNRGCLYPRDRSYPLRAKVEDGNRILVDYAASNAECLTQVLKALSG